MNIRSIYRKKRVLIVDDAPANIKVLWEIIKSDYDVAVATNGQDALQIVENENPPDLILLDIVMPGMDGYEVCRRLKSNHQTQSIPVIFITAKTREEDETKGLELGAVDYITKPFTPAIIRARIRTQIELKQNRDHLEELIRERTGELEKLNEQLLKDIAEREKAEAELRQAREEEAQLLEITTAMSFELHLERLLNKIMDTTKDLLSADRCTLFLADEKTSELWTKIAQGLESKEIRFPNHLGIAGSVYTTGKTINIPDAYVDSRFNPDVDKKTGYRTRSILCMPVKNKEGVLIGAIQVLNKEGGPFTVIDEKRLAAFSAQASIALENAKLFEDVVNMKNYNESMLQSMSNGMISLDADRNIVKCNSAALRILHEKLNELTGVSAVHYFAGPNDWVLESIDRVMETRENDLTMDTDLFLVDGHSVSVNLTVVPLINVQQELIGSLLVLEDITREKRLKGTMARYMTKEIADKLLESGETVLGGQAQEATILFSDIRSFTSISERVGPQETVAMLNEYFSITVDIIFQYQGILDKYIGDAMLAVFGAPFSTGEDPDRAVKTAIDIMLALQEFNRKRVAEKKEPISIGTGINTDEVISGNIGSLKRMDYTVIGDGVNLASRLESANKIYGTQILVSEFTHKGLKDSYVCREIDRVRVKGKLNPVGIYEILDYHDGKSFPHLDDVIDIFHKALTFYRHREWEKGHDLFSKALKLNSNDITSRVYVERCIHFLKNPPHPQWDCAWDMQSK